MIQLSKSEFDSGVKSGKIIDAMIDKAGDQHSNPSIPNRKAIGKRKRDFAKVWAWVKGPKSREAVAK